MVYESASASVAKPNPPPGMRPLVLCSVDTTFPSFWEVTVWVHVLLSDPSLYSMVTWSSGSMATVGPLRWPKLPKTDASTHHWPALAPQYEALSGQASIVVWTRSLVGLERPGHRNSGPVDDVIGG